MAAKNRCLDTRLERCESHPASWQSHLSEEEALAVMEFGANANLFERYVRSGQVVFNDKAQKPLHPLRLGERGAIQHFTVAANVY